MAVKAKQECEAELKNCECAFPNCKCPMIECPPVDENELADRNWSGVISMVMKWATDGVGIKEMSQLFSELKQHFTIQRRKL